MVIVFFYSIFGLFLSVGTVPIPFVGNVYYQPTGTSNVSTTMRFNSTCNDCLCEYFLQVNDVVNTLALNCFANETCQFIQTFSSSYKLVSLVGATLYFQGNIFPNISNCCMPNITEVLTRLQSSAPTMVNLTFIPGAIGYEEDSPDEAVTIGVSTPILYWFNPQNLQFIRNSSTWTRLSVVLYKGLLYTSVGGISAINVLDDQNTTQLGNITDPSLSNTRKLIFLNDGQTMIATAQSVMALSVFERNSPANYTFQESIPFPIPGAHGLAKVNDTFFYGSTWTNSSIRTHSYENNTWTSAAFVNCAATTSGSHIAVDECGRVWYIIGSFGLRIFDPSGLEVASWNMSLGTDSIYDLLLLPNYVLTVTRWGHGRITRYDPQLFC